MSFNPPINLGITGDLNGADLSKIKKNMVSGKDRAGEGFVLQQTSWPHHCLSKASRHILGKNFKVKHHNQTPAQFSEGMIQKIILETPKADLNPLVKNKLKFFSFVTKLTYSLNWKDILSIMEDFFEAVENEHIDWESWPVIERFLKDAYEQIRFSEGFRPRAHSAPDGAGARPNGGGDSGKKMPDDANGVPTSYMKDNHICCGFNLGFCKTQDGGDHKMYNTMLRHWCGGCHKKSKAKLAHPASGCKNGPFGNLFA